MGAVIQDRVMRQGAQLLIGITWGQRDSTSPVMKPYNLTGYRGYARVGLPTGSVEQPAVITAALGTAVVVYSSVITVMWPPGSYPYELNLIDAAGELYDFLAGNLTVNHPIGLP